MSLKTRGVILLSLALLIWWAWGGLFPNHETAIRTRLQTLVAEAEITGTEKILDTAVQAKVVTSFFTTPLTLDFETADYGSITFTSKRELRQKALQAGNALSQLELDLRIASITIRDSTAVVRATGSALGTIKGEGEFFDQHLVELELTHEKGEWNISQIQHIRNERE